VSGLFVAYSARLKMHSRIAMLSLVQLEEEASWKEEEASVMHSAAGSLHLLFAAIDRLVTALGIDYKSSYGSTMIMYAAASANYDILEYLARNKQADLAITDINGENVYTLVGKAPGIPQRGEREYVSCIEG
jgi:hypothetical protein